MQSHDGSRSLVWCGRHIPSIMHSLQLPLIPYNQSGSCHLYLVMPTVVSVQAVSDDLHPIGENGGPINADAPESVAHGARQRLYMSIGAFVLGGIVCALRR